MNSHRIYSKSTSQIIVLSYTQELLGRSGRGINKPLRAYIRVQLSEKHTLEPQEGAKENPSLFPVTEILLHQADWAQWEGKYNSCSPL